MPELGQVLPWWNEPKLDEPWRWARVHLEERIGVAGRQELERVCAQLRADEHELRGELSGDRWAHGTRFGIPGGRP